VISAHTADDLRMAISRCAASSMSSASFESSCSRPGQEATLWNQVSMHFVVFQGPALQGSLSPSVFGTVQQVDAMELAGTNADMHCICCMPVNASCLRVYGSKPRPSVVMPFSKASAAFAAARLEPSLPCGNASGVLSLLPPLVSGPSAVLRSWR
jgi:hypothetical protein